MRPTTTGRAVLLASALGLAGLGLGACSDSAPSTSATTSPSQAYCDSWANVVSAFKAYDQVDVVNGGLDSVRNYFDQLQSAVSGLSSSSDSLLTPKIEAFTTSLSDLGTTLTSPSLPVDRRQQVAEAKVKVDSAWNDLVATAKTACPNVEASTV